MVEKRGKPIGYRTSKECNSSLVRDLGGDLPPREKVNTRTGVVIATYQRKDARI
jgi:hypothetical protein